MESVFSFLDSGVAGLVVKAILFSLLGIFSLILFIVTRRWYRARHLQRVDERMVALRGVWDNLVAGRIPAETWRLNRFDSEIIETMLLDSIEMAHPGELPSLSHCLRSSGLLDLRIYEARHSRGWKRRAALVALGRTRAAEAVPVLVEALNSRSAQTRIAAVRGLGRIGSSQAAVPLLDGFASGRLHVPNYTLMNAMANCCRDHASVLIRYFCGATGQNRELLARVLAEVAGPELGEELLTLAVDELPEVRASAARALGHVEQPFAVWALGELVKDQEWFVRLRAVVALGSVKGMSRIPCLLKAICDCNRLVRQRAAWVLARIEPNLLDVLQQVVDTKDNYALQAFISELERSGGMEKVTWALEGQCASHDAQSVLATALSKARTGLVGSRNTLAAAAGASQ